MDRLFLIVIAFALAVTRRAFSSLPPSSEDLIIRNHNGDELKVEFKSGASLQRDTFRKLKNSTLFTRLMIQNSNLESIHASAFAGLKNLRSLTVAETNITGSIHSLAFSRMPSLTRLYLYGCRIAKLPRRALNRLPSLRRVWLSSNEIDSIDSNALHELPLLSHLEMRDNKVEEIRPNAFSNLQSLFDLQLKNNRFGTLHPNCFHNLPNLRFIWLMDNRIKTFLSNAFNHMDNLCELRLNYNKMKQLSANSFYNYPKLRLLDIVGNRVNVIESYAFQGQSDLEIFLRGNKGKIVKNYAFYNMQNVTRMVIRRSNNFTVVEPLAFPNLTEQQTLSIEEDGKPDRHPCIP